MNFKNHEKFANFKNFKNILMYFVFAIFSRHHNHSHAMIFMLKFHFLKQSIIHHRIYLQCHFQGQCRRELFITVSMYDSTHMKKLHYSKVAALLYLMKLNEFLQI